MSNQKKRSRFAKHTAEEVLPEAADAFSDDYMAPLETLVASGAQSTIRLTENEPIAKKSKQSLQSLMDESREASLAVPISSSNIGFKMLKNFGYKEGEGLGKEGQGTINPISIQKRTNMDVSGLGVLEKRNRVQKTLETIKNLNISHRDQLQSDFLNTKANQQRVARAFSDMKKAQKAMYELDEQAGIPVHELTASLHARYTTAIGGNKTVIDQSVQSLHLNNSTTDSNAEIVYSGYDRYSGADTIDTALEDDHSNANATPLTSDTAIAEPSLQDCLYYLRDVHYYCYYCGAGYTDIEDLINNCPGETEEDH